MLHVKVLGSGCANCRRLEAVVRQTVDQLGLPAEIEKVTDYAAILQYHVLSTPGLVVNEQLVSAGRIPAEREISAWLTSAAPAA